MSHCYGECKYYLGVQLGHPKKGGSAIKRRKLRDIDDVDEFFAELERRRRRNIPERIRNKIRGWMNVIRMKIGTAYLGDFLSIYTEEHENGLIEFRLVDTKRRWYYGPWYVKHDFLGQLLLCRCPTYEPKIPTYRQDSKPEQ